MMLDHSCIGKISVSVESALFGNEYTTTQTREGHIVVSLEWKGNVYLRSGGFKIMTARMRHWWCENMRGFTFVERGTNEARP